MHLICIVEQNEIPFMIRLDTEVMLQFRAEILERLITSYARSAASRILFVDLGSHLGITYQRTEEHFLMLVHLPGTLFQNICGHLI